MNIVSLIPQISREMKLVEGCLVQFIQLLTDEENPLPSLSCVLDNKGKGIRPALVLLCAKACPTGIPREAGLCRLAALTELIHTVSLIHDDIVDDSPLRRGHPTIQAQFGKDMAVYTGDYILSQVFLQLLANDSTNPGRILAQAMISMCRGELAQQNACFNTSRTIESYLDAIQGKTAALFAACCQIGAEAAACLPEDAQLLRDFGHNFGMLFQLADDLADFTSTPQQEGKPVYNDFPHGIYTLPALYSFNRGAAGAKLKALAADRQLGAEEAHKAALLIEEAGGLAYTRQMMKNYAAQARDILNTWPDNAAIQGLNILLTAVEEKC